MSKVVKLRHIHVGDQVLLGTDPDLQLWEQLGMTWGGRGEGRTCGFFGHTSLDDRSATGVQEREKICDDTIGMVLQSCTLKVGWDAPYYETHYQTLLSDGSILWIYDRWIKAVVTA